MTIEMLEITTEDLEHDPKFTNCPITSALRRVLNEQWVFLRLDHIVEIWKDELYEYQLPEMVKIFHEQLLSGKKMEPIIFGYVKLEEVND
jgi:hypothetical protein